MKADGSVSPSDDEKAQSNAQTTRATAEADARKLELARNRLEYTTLRASQDGVVTSVKFEVGQVVAEGQPIVSIAKDVEPEIVVNVPEDQLSVFKASTYKASLDERARSVVRRRVARAVAAGGCDDAHVPRAPEAGDARVRCRSAQAPRSWSSARSATTLRP